MVRVPKALQSTIYLYMLLCSRNRIVLTQEQIAVELGLAGFPEDGPSRRKILQQASNYTQWCKTFGGRWLCFNSGIGSENFLWIKKMVNSSCRKSWQMIAENLSEVNVWKQVAKECRARRAFALSRGVHMDTVSAPCVANARGIRAGGNLAPPAPARAPPPASFDRAREVRMASGNCGLATACVWSWKLRRPRVKSVAFSVAESLAFAVADQRTLTRAAINSTVPAHAGRARGHACVPCTSARTHATRRRVSTPQRMPRAQAHRTHHIVRTIKRPATRARNAPKPKLVHRSAARDECVTQVQF